MIEKKMEKNMRGKCILMLLLAMVAVDAGSTVRYVSKDGDDMNRGLERGLSKATIQVAVDDSYAGDTVILMPGVYHEGVILKDGVSLIGEDGVVLDGSRLGARLLTAEEDCVLPTLIENIVLQNACHNGRGGAALLKGTITMRYCTIRACSGVQCGGVLIEGKANEASALSARLEYCLIHNCTATGDYWPDAGGVANFNGTVSHCTICNNYGKRYGGIHSESTVEYSIMWGNESEEGFVDPANYVSDESLSAYNTNYANDAFEAQFFQETWLNGDNFAADGPQFRYPTSFAGMPQTKGEKAMVLNADYSPCKQSAFAYTAGALRYKKYDKELSGVDIVENEVSVNEGDSVQVHAVIEPYESVDKRLLWTTGNAQVAIVSNGRVKGISAGHTYATATDVSGRATDSVYITVTPRPVVIIHPEVLAADSLYRLEDYTVPSYVKFWVAREAARRDSSDAHIDALLKAEKELQDKQTPYCMVANINGDPQTRMAFCWFTNEGVTDGVVQLLQKQDATEADFENNTEVVTVEATATTTLPLHYAISTSGLIRATGMNKHTAFRYVSHKAIAEGLQPGEQYSWRVGTDGHWSEIGSFQTAGKKQKEFSFIYMTDSHIQDREYVDAARLCAEAVARNETDARFCVFPGDFVDTGTKYNSEWEWERWFEEALRPVIMQMPIVPTDGNHDDSPLLNYTYHFNTDSSFNQQSQVKPQFEGITYSIQYGDLLLMAFSMQDFWLGDYSYETLTSTYFSEDVGNWFREQVKRYPTAKHRVALVHKNLFSGSDHQRDKETPLMRETLLPVFKECEIDLVLQGHDHTYEVIGPIDPDTRTAIRSAVSKQADVPMDPVANMTGKKDGIYDVSDGTLYFIGATCGAKRYTPLTREEMDASLHIHRLPDYFDLFTGMFGQPGAPSYTRVTVRKKEIVLESYKVHEDGATELFNTMHIVRKKKHSSL